MPDIFGVHNNRIALAIEPGVFPVILFGHNHVLEVVQKEETMYINAGTTGASGIRGFQARTPTLLASLRSTIFSVVRSVPKIHT